MLHPMQHTYDLMALNATDRRASSYAPALAKYSHLLQVATEAGNQDKIELYTRKVNALKAHS